MLVFVDDCFHSANDRSKFLAARVFSLPIKTAALFAWWPG